MTASTTNHTSSLTPYIIVKLGEYGSSNFYGGTQQDFIDTREKTVREIKELIAQESDPTSVTPGSSLFARCLKLCCAARGDLAKAVGTENAEAFGRLRTPYRLTHTTTCTDPRYADYGEKLAEKLLPGINQLVKQPARGLQHPLVIKTSAFEGIASQFEVCLIEPSQMDQLQQFRKATDAECGRDMFGRPCVNKTYKTNDTQGYRAANIQSGATTLTKHLIRTEQLTGKSDIDYYVVACSRLQLGDKLYAMSQYVYVLRKDLKITGGIIIHQDVFLIEETMKKTEVVFQEAIDLIKATVPSTASASSTAGQEAAHLTAPSTDLLKIHELIKRAGIFEYLSAHAMFAERGTAACAGWLARALLPYELHPLLDRRDHEREINLDALTALSLSDFMKVYMKPFETLGLGGSPRQ